MRALLVRFLRGLGWRNDAPGTLVPWNSAKMVRSLRISAMCVRRGRGWVRVAGGAGNEDCLACVPYCVVGRLRRSRGPPTRGTRRLLYGERRERRRGLKVRGGRGVSGRRERRAVLVDFLSALRSSENCYFIARSRSFECAVGASEARRLSEKETIVKGEIGRAHV